MSYYLLRCPIKPGDAVLSAGPDLPPPLNLWNGGERFSCPVPTPLEFTIEDEDSGRMPSLFDTGAHLLMSSRLVDEIRGCGVDNLDVYDALIHDMLSGEAYAGYKAVNLVNLIAAADAARSSGRDLGLVKNGLATMWYDKLTLDTSRTRGALMFRMAEKLSYIMIHEVVKRRIEGAGFADLSFVRPEDI